MDVILSSPFLAYGVAPLAAGALGIILPALIVKIFEMIGVLNESNMIQYGSKTTRSAAQKTLEGKISYRTQFLTTLFTAIGPSAVINAIISWKLFPYVFPDLLTLPTFPDIRTFSFEFCTQQLLGDLFLYCGHRIQHESEFLWENFHSIHHKIDTPSVSSTAYIHFVDMTLQTAFPMMIASMIVQAHPVSFVIYVLTRVGENTFNHCGYDNWLINLLTLKFLPGKAGVKHHDEHHHFSNYSRNAKNYAESFIIWDWLFGTLRPSTISTKTN